ncbi:hypothetical protein OG229_00865 [Streptomyces platensis]|uniref:hypothetical protein n=1 Tax=Streptomyces platensis TaxID=58346 RepID=UPI002E14A509|nr:hypothetical protein OG229_00865 [Streptomyces platensis]
MRRANLTHPDGTWSGLTLKTETRPRPELCLLTAEHRLLLTQGEDPVLLGVVHPPAYGVDFFRTDRYRSAMPDSPRRSPSPRNRDCWNSIGRSPTTRQTPKPAAL